MIYVDLNGGNDVLTGTNAVNDYFITGPNLEYLIGLGSPVNFFSVESIWGATGNDNYHFTDAGSLSGDLTGDVGTDQLDYAACTTDVFVNLRLGRASKVGGLMSGIEVLQGGFGNDVLAGGSGNETIRGGDGRDVLIGSNEADALFGQGGEDLLIGGATVYDTNPAGTELNLIHQEWANPNHNYAQRVHLLKVGGGLNGNVVLNTPQVV